MVGGHQPVVYDRKVNEDFLFLDILALANAFFKGLDQFIIDVFADTQKRQNVETRFQKLLNDIPY